MRALLWTSLIVSVGIGFISALSAEENENTSSPAENKETAESPEAVKKESASKEKTADKKESPEAEAPTGENVQAETDTQESPVDTDSSSETDTQESPVDTDSSSETDTQEEPADTDTDTDISEDPDAGVVEESEPESGPEFSLEPLQAETVPAPAEVKVDAPPPPEEPPGNFKYSKGTMEGSLGFSLSGDGDVNYLGFSGRFAYYVMDRLAPAVDLRYTNVVGEGKAEYGYADSLTLMPMLKYVLTKKQVSPYVFVSGGYEWQWASNSAANAWILGLGGGVNVSITKNVMVNIELAALHYWYIKKKVYRYRDNDDDFLSLEDNTNYKIYKENCTGDGCGLYDGSSDVSEDAVVFVDADDNQYLCTDETICGEDAMFKDKKDKDREWFFPLISVGIVVTF